MTVSRRGLAAPDKEESARVLLGRVAVTIDDLQALMDLLQEEHITSGSALIVEFEGGHFDNADDLRKISDIELRNLTIKSSRLEVRLSSDVAVAIGDANLCESVRRRWARHRVTRIRPEGIDSSKHLQVAVSLASMVRLLVALFVLGIVLGVYFGVEGSPAGEQVEAPAADTDWVSMAVGVLLGIVAILVGVAWMRYFYRPPNYAVIIPVTLEEFRREQASDAKHWQNVAIALGALLIAAIGVLVSVLLAD